MNKQPPSYRVEGLTRPRLQLATRIVMRGAVTLSNTHPKKVALGWKACAAALPEIVEHALILVAQKPCDDFESGVRKHKSHSCKVNRRDLGCLFPPADDTFVEWLQPAGSQEGILVQGMDIKDVKDMGENFVQAHCEEDPSMVYALQCTPFIFDRRHGEKPLMLNWQTLIGLNSTGMWRKDFCRDGLDASPSAFRVQPGSKVSPDREIRMCINSIIHIGLTALSMLHTQQVIAVTHEELPRERKWRHRNKVPRIDYKLLVVHDTVARTASEPSEPGASGRRHRQHYCRDHMRRLPGGGKTRIPGHFRGDPKLGKIHKGYEEEE